MPGDEYFPIETGGGNRQQRDDRPRSSSSRGRVPPHNIEAEESVLGALLLSREAIGVVSEMALQPGDFYKPGHRHIFDAIRSLYSAGAPADTVTVADELRRAGLLVEVGGAETLHELQNATPAISSAGHYAKIVQGTALLRQLIYAAGDIAELAYSEPDDVIKTLDLAESRIFNVAEQRVTDTTRTIEDLLPEVMDHLQATYDRGDIITGVATGYTDLDELLSGLQQSALYIVGARPAMGKCVAFDTPMVDPATGDLVTALELMERAEARDGCDAVALDHEGRQVVVPVSHCLADGIKPVFRLRTATGRTAVVTGTHPLLTTRGWTELGRVELGEPIAVPSILPVFGTESIAETERTALAATVDLDDPRAELPDLVLRLRREPLELFLRDVVGGRVTLTVRSPRLAHQIAHALLRVGAPWSLEAAIVGGGYRLVRRTTAPTLPAAVWSDIDKACGATTTIAELAERAGYPSLPDWHAAQGPVARALVADLAELLDDAHLRWWASPDVLWDDVVEISQAGWTQVIDFTVPDLHNFVAGDLYLHNTAFGLGIAAHVAMHSTKPVLVFSLEMAHQELTQRILASEARVDSMKIRTGRLAEADWAKIGKAIGRLEVPLFLDDNPRVTVMEIRAKARRIKARFGGIGLIVIDYLQLMGGSGGSENRQLEVSEISRNLKILARELEVPIIALSQLSRQLEARADKRPMLSDLRESGCLTASTRLVRADTNAEITLGELVESGVSGIPIWSLDERYRVVPANLSAAFASGVKETFRLRLASGRSVDASANHPFLTLDGWRPLEHLAAGTRIASARRLPAAALSPAAPMSDDERFGAVVGVHGANAERLAGSVGAQPTSAGSPDPDVIPADVWEHIRHKSMPTAGVTKPQLAARLGMQHCAATLYQSGLSRDRLQCVADITGDPWLADLATSDVLWDEVIAIEPLGPQPVFDATIDETHNFVANGIVAHNSLEQDADVVMFLYRDEVYHADSPDKGSAEVIVAKHRAGPIGTKRLVFLGQYTRFDNAARSV